MSQSQAATLHNIQINGNLKFEFVSAFSHSLEHNGGLSMPNWYSKDMDIDRNEAHSCAYEIRKCFEGMHYFDNIIVIVK